MKAFSCPQCGASLESVTITGATVVCPYCRSVVIVPAELRPAPPVVPPAPGRRQNVWPFVVAPLVVVALVVAVISSRSRSEQPRTQPARPTANLSFTPLGQRQTPSPTPDPGYTVALTFGGEGTGEGLFQDEQRVAVGSDGNIYVADETFRVQKFDPSGKFVSLWLIPTESKWYRKIKRGPRRLLADRVGRVYAVVGGVVLRYDGASGELLGAFDTPGYALDAVLEPDGGLLVVTSDGRSDDLVKLDPMGRTVKRVNRFVTSVADKALEVEAIKLGVDGVGNVFALYGLGGVYGTFYYDSEDLAVYRYTPDGRYVSKFGSGGNEPGQFTMPAGIALDNQSRIFVNESGDMIRIFAPDGRYLDSIKGPVWANSIAFDSANNLYLAGSHKVFKLLLTK